MVDVDVTIKIPALDKLLDIAASGIGSVAGPMLAPWAARRAAETKRIESQAEGDSLLTIAIAQSEARAALVGQTGQTRGALTITSEQIAQRLDFQEQKRQSNIAAVVNEAAEDLGTEEVGDHELDHDWIARFFGYVQDVSSAEVRKLWAKILAGEVRSPGAVSIRTLSILRNMSRDEALLFAEAMQYRINDFILQKACLKLSQKLTQHHFLFLFEELGLFYSTVNVRPASSIATGREGKTTLMTADLLLFVAGPKNRIIIKDADMVRLKPMGLELAAVCEVKSNPEFVRSFAQHLEKKACALHMTPILERTEEGVKYDQNAIRPVSPQRSGLLDSLQHL